MEANVMTGRVHSLETFGLVDGPGVRFVVFLQGCAMRCQYCHNPETWAKSCDETTVWTPKDLFDRVYRYHRYWGTNGGLTISGGEPLLQMEFVTEVFRLAKEKKVHTALDTAGQPFSTDPAFLKRLEALMEVTDLVLLDFKEIDSEKHQALTGHPNENILELAHWLSDHGKKMWIRHVLVPGLTDSEEGLTKLDAFLSNLKTIDRVEVLPYHTLGLFKWKKLGIDYPLDGVRTPTAEEVQKAEQLLHIDRYPGYQKA